jgi:glutamate/aspartate transport system substrate-binding protein
VDFAYTTYVEEVRMAVNTKSGIKSIKDLNGKTVATTTGTTSVQTLRKNERAEGIDFKTVQGKDHADSFLLLEAGRADAFVMDGSILAANIAKAKNPRTSRSWARCCRSSPSPACCPRATKPQEGHRRFHRAPDQGRLAGQAVRQVVHAADPAQQRQPEHAGIGRHQERLGAPQRQADGRLRQQVIAQQRALMA